MPTPPATHALSRHGRPTLPLFEDQAEAAPAGGKAPIAVIGAGFSGTIAALHLLKRLPPDQPVLLCERTPEFARGVAYASGNEEHLLNVRATNMSALADDPNHFNAWLQRRGAEQPGLYHTEAGLFCSRGLYGTYLRGLLDAALRESAHRAQLRLLPDEVVDIEAEPGGTHVLHTDGGQTIQVAGAILAVGNLPPEEHASAHICANPWGEKAWRRLEGDAPLAIVGTGLTMVDLAVSFRRRGFSGQIVAMSRAGMLPARHQPTDDWPTPTFTLAEEHSLTATLVHLRDEIHAAAERGVDWRAVIDSLRPATARLWQRMPHSERRRFLRHARRFWDVHRHRMAPPHADLIDRMVSDGSLRVVAGRIRRIDPAAGGARVHYTPRGQAAPVTLDAQRVIFASGLEPVQGTRDRLIRRMLSRGLARMDAQGLGLEVTDGLNLVGPGGVAEPRLWAVGPIVRGVFWECVAVPDIRVQASHVAVSVVARLREEAPRWSFII